MDKQPLQVISFLEWTAPAKGTGFDLVRVGGKAGLLVAKPVRHSSYAVFEREPALFRDFTDLDGSDESFLDFANRHGGLTYRDGADGGAERLIFWRACHTWMVHLVGLVDWLRGTATRAPDVEQCRGGLRILPPAAALLREVGVGVAHETTSYAVNVEDDPHALRNAYEAHVCAQVNAEMARRCPLAVERTATAASTSWQAVLAPQDLWGALVAQLFLTVTQARQHRRCVSCGRWFDLGRGLLRMFKQTCDGTCRTRLSRHRRRALTLASGGVAVAEIARELGLASDLVAQWLNGESDEGTDERDANRRRAA